MLMHPNSADPRHPRPSLRTVTRAPVVASAVTRLRAIVAVRGAASVEAAMPAESASMIAAVAAVSEAARMRWRNAVVAGVCGMAAHSGLMSVRRQLGIPPLFQPDQDLQRLLVESVGASLTVSLRAAADGQRRADLELNLCGPTTAFRRGRRWDSAFWSLAWCPAKFVFLPWLGHGVGADAAGNAGNLFMTPSLV